MLELVKKVDEHQMCEVSAMFLITSGSVLSVLESRINTITAPMSTNIIPELPPSKSVVSIGGTV